METDIGEYSSNDSDSKFISKHSENNDYFYIGMFEAIFEIFAKFWLLLFVWFG